MAAPSSTLLKGLSVLRLLGKYPHGTTAATIAEDSGLPFSTAYRLLNSLVSAEFLNYEPRSKIYSLGLPVFEMAQTYAAAHGFDRLLLTELQVLTRVTNESCIYAVLDGNQTVTIQKIDGPEFRTTSDPGDRIPVQLSAMGKAILSRLSDPELSELLPALDFTAPTQYSVTDQAGLTAQLTEARNSGVAYQREELDVGMNALGAPVVNASGTVLGAVAIAAPLFRADEQALRAHTEHLLSTATRLATLLPERP